MSRRFDYDLIVIGSGPAGLRGAIQAAVLGKKVAIADESPEAGGVCVHSGTIPSKSFKEAVLFLSGIRQRNLYGLSYRVKSDVSMSDLTFRCRRMIENEVETIKDTMRRNSLELIQGRAAFIDQNTISITNLHDMVQKKTAEKFLIATGGKPFRPDNVPFNSSSIFDSEDILRIKELPRDLVVVGGGVIGTEYGSMFSALGVNVIIVDSRRRLLGFVDEEIIECLHYQLRSLGVTLRLGEEVRDCQPREDGRVLTHLESGKVIVSDAVLYSAGRVSCSDGLNLEALGVKIGNKGAIAVDENYRTACANIYAAGDVVGFPALASTSARQGRLAICHAFGLHVPPSDIPMPYGIYSIPEISYVGKSEQELTEAMVPYESGVAHYREVARGNLIGDRDGLLKILFHLETREVLGVHIIGEGASELIHIGQAVMGYRGQIDYFIETVFNYPTLAECYKVAAHNGINKLV